MICASAVGYYGDRGEDLLSESEESGDDYFSHVVSEWEKAAQPAIDAGIRVVFLRIAPVMSPLGGALQVLGNAARLGSSPPVAGGKQWWSWISLDDVVDVHCLRTRSCLDILFQSIASKHRLLILMLEQLQNSYLHGQRF